MSTQFERTATRTAAGSALLLMLALPASLIAWAWTGDWQWPVTGVGCFATGFCVGVVIRDVHKGQSR